MAFRRDFTFGTRGHTSLCDYDYILELFSDERRLRKLANNTKNISSGRELQCNIEIDKVTIPLKSSLNSE